MVELVINGYAQNVALVIKIKCYPSTLALVVECQWSSNPITICNFGVNLFKWLVDSIPYRVQFLHHATVLSFNWVIFAVASDNTLIHSIMIHFSDIDLYNYPSIIRNLSNTHLCWIYNEEPFPASEFTHVGLWQKSYGLSVHIIFLQFEFWKRMMDIIHEKGAYSDIITNHSTVGWSM